MSRPEQALACLPGLTNNPTYFGGSAVADSDSIRREKARIRAAKWYASNKARASAAAKLYRVKNADALRARKRLEYLRAREKPEFIERLRAYAAATKDEKREYDREYRLKNAAKLDAIKAAWRADNSSLIRAVKNSYKARRRSVEKDGDSSQKVRAWLEHVPKVCIWCLVPCADNFHIDHFQPLALGGEHRVSNLAIACPTCNVRKNALPPEEFCRRMGFDFAAIVERHRCDVGMIS